MVRKIFLALMFLTTLVIPAVLVAQNCGNDSDLVCRDSVFTEVIVDTLIIHHTGAWYNCVPKIDYEILQRGRLISVIEKQTAIYAKCRCCQELSTSLILNPGKYQLVFCWEDYQGYQTQATLVCDTLLVIIGDSMGDGTRYTRYTAVDNNNNFVLPSLFSLQQNYPNPFNSATTLSYVLLKDANVNLSVYNIVGKKVAELVNGTVKAGRHTITWNADNVASGVYFYKVKADNFITTRKMILIK